MERPYICLVSERVPPDYLAMLRDKDISYIMSGRSAVDLLRAVSLLAEHFSIPRLRLEGGGHINGVNGAFLKPVSSMSQSVACKGHRWTA